MAPRETENNAYAKFWDDKKRPLWYVMVFSGVVNYTECQIPRSYQPKLSISYCVILKMPVIITSEEREVKRPGS